MNKKNPNFNLSKLLIDQQEMQLRSNHCLRLIPELKLIQKQLLTTNLNTANVNKKLTALTQTRTNLLNRIEFNKGPNKQSLITASAPSQQQLQQHKIKKD